MKKMLILLALFLMGGLTAGAQEQPKVEAFLGYSYVRFIPPSSSGVPSFGLNGGSVSITYNPLAALGFVADIGGYRAGNIAGAPVSLNMYTYMFGPTVTANLGRSAVFAHALFGQAHSSLGAGVNIPVIGGISTGLTSATAFAMAFGGGVDIGLTRHLAIRAAQVDYLRTQFSATDALTTGLSSSLGNRQNTFRYSAGIVFRF